MALADCIYYLGKPYEGKPHVRFDEGSRESAHEWELRPCPTLQSDSIKHMNQNSMCIH